ncbi:MAG TPA: hypothetical protein PLI18_03140 [Pirellulaceae bacterium]|nr:hypothetical protein [Pirellulaceae bacterium]
MSHRIDDRRSLYRSVSAWLLLSLVTLWPAMAQAQTPPIPSFAVQFWDVPGRTGAISLSQMNRFGEIVGSYYDGADRKRTFLYAPSISVTTAIDLENLCTGGGIPAGWTFDFALDINDQGIILGNLVPVDPTVIEPITGLRPERGFMIDSQAASPSVVLLPEFEGIPKYRPLRLNESGDIVARYWVAGGSTGVFFYNPLLHDEPILLDVDAATVELGERVNGVAMVGGQANPRGTTAYRSFPELGITTYVPNLTNVWWIYGMNDQGNFCGGYNAGPLSMRIIGDQLQPLSPTRTGAWSINNSNDVMLGGGYLFRDDRGTINLTSYLSGAKADITRWKSATTIMTTELGERDATTKYGRMAGYLAFYVNGVWQKTQPFSLTPVAKRR